MAQISCRRSVSKPACVDLPQLAVPSNVMNNLFGILLYIFRRAEIKPEKPAKNERSFCGCWRRLFT
jgi:hypothetical protein